MLFVPILIQALAFLPIQRVGVPNLPVADKMAYDGGTEIAISRYGCSPSFEISAAYTGFTPSFDMSTVRMGATPVLDLFTCHFDTTLLMESGECADFVQPLSLLPLLLVRCKSASLISLLFQLVGRLVGLCASFITSLPAFFCYLVCWLWAMLFAGLYGVLWFVLIAFFIVGCPALALVGAFLISVGIASQIAFTILAIVLFNCFCGCLFVGHVGCCVFFKVGRWAFAVLGIICFFCGSFIPLLSVPCAFAYYAYCEHVTGSNPDKSFFIDQVSFAMVSFGNGTEAIVRTLWEPVFSVALSMLFFFSRLFVSFLFLFGVRHFFTSPSPAFF